MQNSPPPERSERISYDLHDEDAWICRCGNTPTDEGFYPCNDIGTEVEPTEESGWAGLYVCDRCGRIIKQSTLEVQGKKTDLA